MVDGGGQVERDNYPQQYWHCKVRYGAEWGRYAVVNDLSFEQLKRDIVEPWLESRPFAVAGRIVDPTTPLEEIRIAHTAEPQQAFAQHYDAAMARQRTSDNLTDRKLLPLHQGEDFTNELLFVHRKVPTPRSPRLPSASTQTINVHGGTVNIGQTHSGNVSQQIALDQDKAEVRRLLRELEEAIRQLDAPEEERESFLAPVEQLQGELRQEKPLTGRLVPAWGAITAFGSVESAWQGWERVQRIAVEVGPKVGELIQSMTS